VFALDEQETHLRLSSADVLTGAIILPFETTQVLYRKSSYRAIT
jgi:hypothetical protein